MVVLTIPTFVSCSSEEHETIGNMNTSYHKITFSDIENLTPEAVTIKVLVWDNESGKDMELATAAITNANAEIMLPEIVEDRFLYRFADDAPAEVELTDRELRYTFISFVVFNSEDRLIGRVYFESETVATDLIYADRACMVTGVHTREYEYQLHKDIYSLNLSRGYHWTQYDIESEMAQKWTNGTPHGARWIYAPLW